MGDLVLSNVIEEKGRNGLLAILLLTGKLISESFFEVNIPIFPGPDLTRRVRIL